MAGDGQESITAGAMQEWSVHGEARQMYESRWLHFVGKAKGKKALGKLLYTDVPWPAEEDTSAEELVAILLSGVKVYNYLHVYLADQWDDSHRNIPVQKG